MLQWRMISVLMMLEMLMGLMKSWMMSFSLSASRPRRMVNSKIGRAHV